MANTNLAKHNHFRNCVLALGSFIIAFILGTTLIAPVFDRRFDILNLYPQSEDVQAVGDEPFTNTANLGWEFLDDGKVIHAWNIYDDYYFNNSNGIQLSNHYEEYWTHNVLMLGYYSGNVWNLVYRTDELSGFNRQFNGTTDEYMNLTLWKDLSYGSYNFRLAIRYHLEILDENLTIIPYIKNLGIAIPYTLGFGWELKDIKIDNNYENDRFRLSNTSYSLHDNTLWKNYTNLADTVFWLDDLDAYGVPEKTLFLRWNPNLNYLLQVKARTGQYNAPVTLFIKVGTLNINQEKFTTMYWHDADATYGNAYKFVTGTVTLQQIATVDTNIFAIAYIDGTAGKVIVGKNTDGVITYGASATADADVVPGGYNYFIDVCKVTTNTIAVIYVDDDDAEDSGWVRVYTINPTTLALTSADVDEFEAGTTGVASCCYVADSKWAIVYNDKDDSDTGKTVVCTWSGSATTVGTPTSHWSGTTDYAPSEIDSCYMSDNKIAWIFGYGDSLSVGQAFVATISGTTPTIGTVSQVFTATNSVGFSICSPSSTSLVFACSAGGTDGKVTAATVSGTTITLGTEKTFTSDDVTSSRMTALNSTHFMIVYTDSTNGDYGRSLRCYVTWATKVITISSPETFASDDTYSEVIFSNAGPDVAVISPYCFAVSLVNDTDNDDGYVKIGTVSGYVAPAAPTFASESPTNNSIDQVITPQCAITINDANGDLMTLSWFENSTGSYICRQTNSSCANGIYRWTFAQASSASTKYWWKVYANDGTHNVSAWYCFTTEAGIVEQWNTIATWNGSVFNQSAWNQIQLWNGSLYNQSIFNQIADWNGSLVNQSSWNQISQWNGSIYNETNWIQTSLWNGSLWNSSGWEQITDWNGTIYNQSNWNQITLWNGSIYNASNFLSIQEWNGSIYNETNWIQTSLFNGTIYNESVWSQVNLWNGTLFNTSQWNLIDEYNGTIYNQTGTNLINDWNGSIQNNSIWNQISLWNGSIFNTSSYHIIQDINGTVFNASSYSQISIWNGTIYNITGFVQIQDWNGTVYNTSGFKQIALWNGTIFNTSGYTQINLWNGSLYNTSAFEMMNDWNGSIWNTSNWIQTNLWNGSIFNTSAYIQISLWNGTIYNQTAFIQIQNWNGSIYNISNWLIVSEFNGTIWNQSSWQDQEWNGTIYNESNYKQMQDWNGSLHNQSTWHQISLWNGSIFNVSIGFVLINDWNGTVYNQSSWQDIDWNGTLFNTSGYSQIDLWNGTLFNQSNYHLIQELNGTIYNVSIGYVIVNNWNGSVWNQSTWNLVEEWNGSIYNQTAYNEIQDWNGSIFNQSGHHLIQEWNGSIFNVSIGFVLVQEWNGSLYNQSLWNQVSLWNGSIFNTSAYTQIGLWNGTLYNQSGYHLISEHNGTIFNVSIGFIPINDWNGTVYNQSSWYDIDWNGTIFNTSGYSQIDLWNGSLYNQSLWHQTSQWNGTIYNISIGFVLVQNWNGTIYNQSSWSQVSLWNGTVFNTSAFESINDWNGTLYNQSQYYLINQWNGSLYNTSIGFIIVNDWNGSIYNTSAYIQVNLWNGSIFNQSSYHLIQDWNGSIFNVSIGFVLVQEWNGTIYNISGYTQVNLWNGTIFNQTIKIDIINEYPANNSYITSLQPTVFFTIIGSSGSANYSIYVGNSSANTTILLYNQTYVGNGTYSRLYFAVTEYYRNYYWRVNVTDDVYNLQKIFKFTTMQSGIGGYSTQSPMIYMVAGLIGLLGLLGIMWRRRRRRDEGY